MSIENNPYHGVVIGLVSNDRDIFTDWADFPTDSTYRVALNLGRLDDIAIGQKFLIFANGKEMNDPISKNSLGFFEVIRGIAQVEHVQEKMCTLKSLRTKRVRRAKPATVLTLATGIPQEYTEVDELAPFINVQIGDFARLI